MHRCCHIDMSYIHSTMIRRVSRSDKSFESDKRQKWFLVRYLLLDFRTDFWRYQHVSLKYVFWLFCPGYVSLIGFLGLAQPAGFFSLEVSFFSLDCGLIIPPSRMSQVDYDFIFSRVYWYFLVPHTHVVSWGHSSSFEAQDSMQYCRSKLISYLVCLWYI